MFFYSFKAAKARQQFNILTEIVNVVGILQGFLEEINILFFFPAKSYFILLGRVILNEKIREKYLPTMCCFWVEMCKYLPLKMI